MQIVDVYIEPFNFEILVFFLLADEDESIIVIHTFIFFKVR